MVASFAARLLVAATNDRLAAQAVCRAQQGRREDHQCGQSGSVPVPKVRHVPDLRQPDTDLPCGPPRLGCGSRGSAGGGTRTLTRITSTDFRTVYGFRRPAARFRRLGEFAVWTIPSPCPDTPGIRCCPSSLYTFPARVPPPGLARDCHYRFPRIWAVLHRRFPGEHSSFDSSPLRLPFRHARMARITVQRRPRVKEPDGDF